MFKIALSNSRGLILIDRLWLGEMKGYLKRKVAFYGFFKDNK